MLQLDDSQSVTQEFVVNSSTERMSDFAPPIPAEIPLRLDSLPSATPKKVTSQLTHDMAGSRDAPWTIYSAQGQMLSRKLLHLRSTKEQIHQDSQIETMMHTNGAKAEQL